jgi:hypothetical protein
MTRRADEALSALTLAQQARTAVAASVALWLNGDQLLAVPFVEEAGSLLLLVDAEQQQDLLEGSTGYAVLGSPLIASVRIAGSFWAVPHTVADEILAEMRACHLECLDCPARRVTRVVGLQVERVELELDEGSRPVDIDAYESAQPDWVLAVGIPVLGHLNAAHSEEVFAAAAAVTGQSPDHLISAQVEWIDGLGFDVSMVDETGGQWMRFEFAAPVVDPDRLSVTVHESLTYASRSTSRPEFDD